MSLEDALEDHMKEEHARSVAKVLCLGVAYAEGDALAGMKLGAVDPAEWETLTELLAEAGYKGELTGRMDVVSFTSNPSTDDERLNAEIKDL